VGVGSAKVGSASALMQQALNCEWSDMRFSLLLARVSVFSVHFHSLASLFVHILHSTSTT
jgi:hypothetical protein